MAGKKEEAGRGSLDAPRPNGPVGSEIATSQKRAEQQRVRSVGAAIWPPAVEPINSKHPLLYRWIWGETEKKNGRNRGRDLPWPVRNLVFPCFRPLVHHKEGLMRLCGRLLKAAPPPVSGLLTNPLLQSFRYLLLLTPFPVPFPRETRKSFSLSAYPLQLYPTYMFPEPFPTGCFLETSFPLFFFASVS